MSAADDLLQAFARLSAPLRMRLANMLARGVVKRVNDAPKFQELQLIVGADETRDHVERVQQYGFTSRPHADAEAVVLFVGGRRDHGLCVAVDDRRYRIHVAEGEVALYASAGQSILLKADGSIEIGGGTMQPVALGQDVRDELDAIWDAIEQHTHGGVQSGAAFTGAASASTPPTVRTGKTKTVKSSKVKAKV